MHHYEGENLNKKVWGGHSPSPDPLPLGRWYPPKKTHRRLWRLDTLTFGSRPRLDKFRKSNPDRMV